MKYCWRQLWQVPVVSGLLGYTIDLPTYVLHYSKKTYIYTHLHIYIYNGGWPQADTVQLSYHVACVYRLRKLSITLYISQHIQLPHEDASSYSKSPLQGCDVDTMLIYLLTSQCYADLRSSTHHKCPPCWVNTHSLSASPNSDGCAFNPTATKGS